MSQAVHGPDAARACPRGIEGYPFAVRRKIRIERILDEPCLISGFQIHRPNIAFIKESKNIARLKFDPWLSRPNKKDRPAVGGPCRLNIVMVAHGQLPLFARDDVFNKNTSDPGLFAAERQLLAVG